METSAPAPQVTSTLQQLLFIGRNLNFQLATDQSLSKVFTGTNYLITNIVVKQKSGAASGLTAGGLYDGVSKTGNIIVLASQVWSTLAAGLLVQPPLVALSAQLTASTLFISLTTGSTTASIADVFVFGSIID